jgi:hypothetical protein
MIEQPDIPIENCSSRMRCFYCWKYVQRLEVAAIRAFSGSQGGGEGYPACAAHATRAITEAMSTFASKAIDPTTWKVTVYLVEDDGCGYPKLGHKLFIARLKA